MQQTSETKMVTQIAGLMARMKREEVPECWLPTLILTENEISRKLDNFLQLFGG